MKKYIVSFEGPRLFKKGEYVKMTGMEILAIWFMGVLNGFILLAMILNIHHL